MSSVNQMKRLLSLLDALQSEVPYNAGQLAEKLGVSRRTMFRDLRSLEKLGVQAAYNEQSQRYTVTIDDSLVDTAEIKPSQLQALVRLDSQKSQSGTLTLEPPSTSVALPEDVSVTPLPASRTSDDQPWRSQGYRSNVLNELNASISSSLCCTLEWIGSETTGASPWNPGPNEQIDRLHESPANVQATIEPYRLFSVLGSRYLLGRDRSTTHLKLIRQSEIISVAPAAKSFISPDDDQIDSLTRRAWHDRFGSLDRPVILRVASSLTNELASEVPDATMEWLDDRSALMTFVAVDFDALTRWVLAQGPQVAILNPSPLRERIARELAATARLYDQPGADPGYR